MTRISPLPQTGPKPTESVAAYIEWCQNTPQFKGAVREAVYDQICYGKTLKTLEQYLKDHENDKEEE